MRVFCADATGGREGSEAMIGGNDNESGGWYVSVDVITPEPIAKLSWSRR